MIGLGLGGGDEDFFFPPRNNGRLFTCLGIWARLGNLELDGLNATLLGNRNMYEHESQDVCMMIL